MADEPGGDAGRLNPDPSLQVLDAGRVLVGGSPLTVLRVSTPVDLAHVRSPQVRDRLLDTGMAHPVPSTGPFTAADVTVVVPVHDHPEALSQTLAGLIRSDPRPGGIVIVDDASADADAIAATVAVTGDVSARLIRRSTNGGAAAARNTGTEAVTTPLVAYLDAGCVPEPGWLDGLLGYFADPTVALVAPRVVADPQRWSDGAIGSIEPTRWARRIRAAIAGYESHRSPLDLGDRPARIAPRTRVSYVPAACFVVRTGEFRRVGGFDEALRVGEDVDLVWRLADRDRLRYVPDATVRHDIRTEPIGWLRRRFDYGTSAAPLAQRHRDGPVPVSASGWSFALWTAAALGHPVTALAIGAASTALLVRRLTGIDHAPRLAIRIAGVGNLAAGGLFANALRRTWWPIAIPAAAFGPRALRRATLAAFVVPPLLRWRRGVGVDPVSWLVLCTADDVAYGAGVWAGCVRGRTVRPLLPVFTTTSGLRRARHDAKGESPRTGESGQLRLHA